MQRDFLRRCRRVRGVFVEGHGPHHSVVQPLRKIHAGAVRRHQHRDVRGVAGRCHPVRGPHEHRGRGPRDERSAEPFHQRQVQVGVARFGHDQIIRVSWLRVQLEQCPRPGVLHAGPVVHSVEHEPVAEQRRRRVHAVDGQQVRVKRPGHVVVDDFYPLRPTSSGRFVAVAAVREMRVHGDVVTAPVQFVHVCVEHHLMTGSLDRKHSQNICACGYANHKSEQHDLRTFRKPHFEVLVPKIYYFIQTLPTTSDKRKQLIIKN